MENITIATDKLIALTNNKDNSGLYTITHPADSALQIGATEDITEYRYRGASPKNYVTFNNEVWRILGVFPTDDGTGKIENRIKIIRNESIKSDKWNTSSSNNWKNSSLNTYLNETYYNSIKNDYKKMIDEHLLDFLPNIDNKSISLYESMKYSLTAGGKRIRPVLLLATCEMQPLGQRFQLAHARFKRLLSGHALPPRPIPSRESRHPQSGSKPRRPPAKARPSPPRRSLSERWRNPFSARHTG